MSEDKYRRIFCTSYNIGFKVPKSDTCKTCDSLAASIQALKPPQDDQEIALLTREKDLHQLRASAMKDQLKKETVDLL